MLTTRPTRYVGLLGSKQFYLKLKYIVKYKAAPQGMTWPTWHTLWVRPWIYPKKNKDKRWIIRHKMASKNKSILKTKLVFFLRMSTVARVWRSHCEDNKEKEHLQTPSPNKALKNERLTCRWQRDLRSTERTSVGGNFQGMHAYNTSPSE
jgi:hypothetical protein